MTAVISGSQQLLVLPREQQGIISQTDIERDKDLARLVQRKIKGRSRDGLNNLYVYALQTPIMLLTFSVMTFLAGLCSVVFSPLARNPAWTSEAKVGKIIKCTRRIG